MSLFEWILVVISFVFWTILVFAFGFGVGYTYLKDRKNEQKDLQKDTDDDLELEFTPSQLLSISQIVSEIVDATADSYMGPPGVPGEPGKTPDAKEIVMYNGDSLDDWAQAMYDRVKRVERRAGMSV